MTGTVARLIAITYLKSFLKGVGRVLNWLFEVGDLFEFGGWLLRGIFTLFQHL